MKSVFINVFLLFNISCIAQIQEFIKSNTIDISKNENLHRVLENISDNRIIMLGEQRHEDAATFKVKAEIVKILHQNFGYSILCLEYPFYELNKNWQLHEQKQISANDLLPGVVESCWKNCREFNEGLVQYTKDNLNTNNELKYLGMDTGDNGRYLSDSLLFDLSVFLESIDLKPNNKFYSLLDERLYCSSFEVRKEIKAELDAQILLLLEAPELQNEQNHFMVQTLKSILNDFSSMKRDYQMAENLKWILEEAYPNEKVIVWAHNSHIEKSPSSEVSNINSMTSYLQESKYRDSIYVVGFTSLKGIAGGEGLGEDYKVKKPKKKSIEKWINDLQMKTAFVDLSTYTIDSPFHMKGKNHRKSHKRNWHQMFDGIIYIEEMYPCSPN